jgi:putative DNA primase/helicase
MKIATKSIIQQLTSEFKAFVRAIGKLTAPRPRTVPANCVNISALLMHLCDFDQKVYSYVLKWLAYPLVNPGVKMQYALAVNGPPGTGSSLFFGRIVAAIYGDQARRVTGLDLTQRVFNDWISGAGFIIVEDALSPKALACLKSLVSSPSVMVSRKAHEPRVVHNEMNFVHLSNSEAFLPLSAGDRRFMVIEAPPAREPLFYKAVDEEIQNGGIEAFRDYLMSSVDLSNFNQFDGPPKPLIDAQLVQA